MYDMIIQISIYSSMYAEIIMIKKYSNYFMNFSLVVLLLLPLGTQAMQLSDLDEDRRAAYLAEQAAIDAQQVALLEVLENGNEPQVIMSETPETASGYQGLIQMSQVATVANALALQEPESHKKTVPCLKFFSTQAYIRSGNGASSLLPAEANIYVALCKIASGVGQVLPRKFINEGKVSRNLLNGEIASIAKHGYNSLAVAMHNHDLESFDALVAAGVNPNVRDAYGCPLLVLAAHDGNDYYVNRLLEMPTIEVNAADSFGETALLHATREGHVAIIERLSTYGANTLVSNIAHKKAFNLVPDRLTALSLLGNVSKNVAGNVQTRLFVKNFTPSKYELVVQPK